MQKFRQSSIVFEKPVLLTENLKILTSSNYPTFLLKVKQNKKIPTQSFVDITK